MAKIGEKRSAGEENMKFHDHHQSKMATPSASSLFKPSSLASVASTLTKYTKDVPSDSKKSKMELPKFKFSEGTESVKSPVKFTAPSIMKVDTPRSFDNGGQGSPMKRPLNGSSDDFSTPSKRNNLFIECLSQPLSSASTVTSESSSVISTDTSKDVDKAFVFGEHLSSRVVNQESSQSTTSTPPSMITDDKDSPAGGSSSSIGGVSQQTTPTLVLPAVETVTGEEGERHVTQISCSLYVFDSGSHNWKERGRGELRLNDTPKSEGAYQSRLIMRAVGSRRVCLNTHLWSSMKCERVGKKSIRITAQEANGGFGVYIVKGLPKDITSMYDAINRRLDALKVAIAREKSDQQLSTDPRPSSLLAGSPGEDDCIQYSSSPSSIESSPERPTERLDKPYTTTSPLYNTATTTAHTTSSSSSTVLFSSTDATAADTTRDSDNTATEQVSSPDSKTD